MAIELSGLAVPLGSDDDEIKHAAAARLGVKPDDIARLRVARQSLDARRDVRLVLTVEVRLHDGKRQRALEQRFGRVELLPEQPVVYGGKAPGQPVVVGAGPCGLFAALTLAQHGYRPLLIERGRDMERRVGHKSRQLREIFAPDRA